MNGERVRIEIVEEVMHSQEPLVHYLGNQYGNYFVQKAFQYGTCEQCEFLISQITPTIGRLKTDYEDFGHKIYTKLVKSYPKLQKSAKTVGGIRKWTC